MKFIAFNISFDIACIISVFLAGSNQRLQALKADIPYTKVHIDEKMLTTNLIEKMVPEFHLKCFILYVISISTLLMSTEIICPGNF